MTDEKTIKDVIYEETFESLDRATWGNENDGYVNLNDLLTPDGEKTIKTGMQNVADLSDGVATDIIEKIEPFIKEYERLKYREQLAHELLGDAVRCYTCMGNGEHARELTMDIEKRWFNTTSKDIT